MAAKNFIQLVHLHVWAWFTNILQLQITADKSVIASRVVDVYVTDTPPSFAEFIGFPFLMATQYTEKGKVDTQS